MPLSFMISYRDNVDKIHVENYFRPECHYCSLELFTITVTERHIDCAIRNT